MKHRMIGRESYKSEIFKHKSKLITRCERAKDQEDSWIYEYQIHFGDKRISRSWFGFFNDWKQ